MKKYVGIKNVGLVIFGIIIALILSELLLRISGFIYQGILFSKDAKNGETEETYTILCLGDSFTFGYGAPHGKSYPEQLEQLLNSGKKGSIFKVVNRGTPGQNTSELLIHLKDIIDTVTPEVVIILIGNNNGFWNLWGYSIYKNERRPVGLLKDHFYNLRLYKVLKMFILTIKAKRRKSDLLKEDDILYDDCCDEGKGVNLGDSNSYNDFGLLYKDQGECDQAIQWFKKGIADAPTLSDNYRDIGWIYYYDKKNYREAVEWFKRAIKVNQFDGDSYAGIGYAYRRLRKYKEALMWLEKGILACPHYHRCYACLISVYKDTTTYREKEMFNSSIALLKDNKETFREIRNYEDLFTQNENIYSEINKWIESDLYKIVELCKEHNITTILQNYPGKRRLSYILKRFSVQHSIPFADNYYSFNKIMGQSAQQEAYFAQDGIHCNARGYGVMAKNVYDVLIKEKIILR